MRRRREKAPRRNTREGRRPSTEPTGRGEWRRRSQREGRDGVAEPRVGRPVRDGFKGEGPGERAVLARSGSPQAGTRVRDSG